MHFECEIPEAKFRAGDVVKRPNADNPGSIHFLITCRIVEGSWCAIANRTNDKAVTAVVENDDYVCVIQADSFDDGAAYPRPVRPGTTCTVQREKLDEDGVKVEWSLPLVAAAAP